MTVEITREVSPVTYVAVCDTAGTRCLKIRACPDGATFEHGAVGSAFLKPDELRAVAEALTSLAARADALADEHPES